MKLAVIIYDTLGNEINEGDWLRVTCRTVEFYVQCKLLENGKLQPFDNFSFANVKKMEFKDIPEHAQKSEAGYYSICLDEDSNKRETDYIFDYRDFDKPFYKLIKL